MPRWIHCLGRCTVVVFLGGPRGILLWFSGVLGSVRECSCCRRYVASEGVLVADLLLCRCPCARAVPLVEMLFVDDVIALCRALPSQVRVGAGIPILLEWATVLPSGQCLLLQAKHVARPEFG